MASSDLIPLLRADEAGKVLDVHGGYKDFGSAMIEGAHLGCQNNIGVQALVDGSYWPPEVPPQSPPHTIIRLPVHTAEWLLYRPDKPAKKE